MGEEENVCRVCRFEQESWAHVLGRCTGDEGGGEWMWSGARMDEGAGRDERKSRMHGVGESFETVLLKEKKK